MGNPRFFLNTSFSYQKVHSKAFSAPDSSNIFCKNNNLSGSDPANSISIEKIDAFKQKFETPEGKRDKNGFILSTTLSPASHNDSIYLPYAVTYSMHTKDKIKIAYADKGYPGAPTPL